jgi:hypothetical protein
MSKQTATEWLFKQLWEEPKDKMVWYAILDKAKEMDKERIETAYNKGTVHGIDYPESTLPLTGEQYYKQTYGGNK